MYGWWGKVLYVDLTTKRVKEVVLDEKYYVEYIGGRGLAVRLLWD
ncbi:MAG: hypothetical protein LM555_02445, partial [Desulfurococcaceae archaeon]|nr:hypothetical protein [Desulfurococcaceae archaeon]